MAQFFIHRPIFAWVIAIIIMLAGVLAIRQLPVSQYPAIAPPQVSINASYPGASAKTVEDTVTQVIEQKLNATITAQTLLSTPDQFDNILLRTNTDGSTVRLRNVARTELGSESYDSMAFFGGSTGVIYRQFSITIVSAMILSVAVAMILTPALCATLLKPVAQGHAASERGWFGGFFRWFNRMFDRSSGGYRSLVGRMLPKTGRYMIIYAVIVAAMSLLFLRMPTAFLPDEGQGFMYSMVQLPVGATRQRTLKVLEIIEHPFLEEQKEAVESLFTVPGGGGE